MTARYDIAIAGGGMVGASLALALAKASLTQPLRIALFEAFPLPRIDQVPLPPSYDARSTALSYGSARLFEQLGIWAHLAGAVAAIERIEVSDRGHFGVTRLDAASEGMPALGYVVENRALGRTLLEAVAEQDNIELLCPAEVVSARMTSDGMKLRVSDEADQLSDCLASLLVVADGGRSGLCAQLQIDQQQTPYEQCALIANLTLDRSHQGCAYERFTADGPMALLPLSDDAEGQPRAALVWSVPLEQADELCGWDDDRFLAEFQRRFGYRAGCALRIGERHSYPLSLVRAREQARRGTVVLGNAAHTLHPIAGQGFNLALRGALALADRVVAQRNAAGALDDLAMLQAYVDGQRADQRKTIGFSDLTTRLFSNARPPLVVARNLGLLGLDLIPALKQSFGRSAMGLDQPAPSFLQEIVDER
ncbi:2-octaprenyl-6-methoxyphenyl hydroxylase [Motiliproteus sediminis]|uniref:2-octaprenyl-6-methoxyphenyl hydroxylase n=1 Tax=Motiliproteus sediminis TaxID=1468178 RepID=UPI001AEF6ED3|nr:2-octaprenyl-6-methoxyphenyl hydroxylase [Motiliproteus sediminis]